jgi:two-component sensor histidine kinase
MRIDAASDIVKRTDDGEPDTVGSSGRSAAPGEMDGASIALLELRHRMKNLLGIVQAVANQTLRSGRSIDEARQALDGRFAAMGQAVDMLLQTGWSAGGLDALVGTALIHAGSRIRTDGPPVTLGADAVMALTLVVHELESNALKYGALSNDEGRVEIGWRIAQRGGEPWLEFEWTEHGGPPCTPPSRQGFGSRMIAKLLGGRFRGASQSDYRKEGLCWTFRAPLAALSP